MNIKKHHTLIGFKECLLIFSMTKSGAILLYGILRQGLPAAKGADADVPVCSTVQI